MRAATRALASFPAQDSPNPNLNWLPIGLRPSSTIDSLARCRHSSALGQLLLVLSLRPSALTIVFHHPLHHLASVCNSVSFSSFCRCTNLCLGLLDPSPHSLGFSSSAQSGRCSSSARSCAAQGHMSACRTRPAANPGGPQGGAQTGRRWGGGAGRKLSRPAPKPNVAGVSQVPRQDLLRLVRNGHGDTHRRPEFR